MPARGGAPSARGGAPRTFHQPDKNLYVHLLGNLRKKALLPVVVFTLSKKRCEENASTLTNADLCTSVEKSEVHVAIEKALSRLKGKYWIRSLVPWTHKRFLKEATESSRRSAGCATCCPAVLVYIMVACSPL